MSISILVEPSKSGFRATTGGPLDLTAEALSAAEALKVLQAKIACRLEQGWRRSRRIVPSKKV